MAWGLLGRSFFLEQYQIQIFFLREIKEATSQLVDTYFQRHVLSISTSLAAWSSMHYLFSCFPIFTCSPVMSSWFQSLVDSSHDSPSYWKQEILETSLENQVHFWPTFATVLISIQTFACLFKLSFRISWDSPLAMGKPTAYRGKKKSHIFWPILGKMSVLSARFTNLHVSQSWGQLVETEKKIF